MATSYTGDGTSVSNFPSSAIAVTIPADGDAQNAASVNISIKKLADYMNYLQTFMPWAVCRVAADGTLGRHIWVSAASKFSTGIYTVTLQNAVAASDVPALANVSDNGSGITTECFLTSTTSVTVLTRNSSGTATDAAFSLVVFNIP